MNLVDVNHILNRLLVLHSHSLAAYLSYASPWFDDSSKAASDVLTSVAADHKTMVDRIDEMIVENHGNPISGEFPMSFTSLHDLSMGFLITKLVEHQENMIAEIERCVDQLRLVPMAQALAQEALGEAKGHLESLKEASQQPAESTS